MKTDDWGSENPIGAMAWRPDGSALLCGRFKAGIQMLNPQSGQLNGRLIIDEGGNPELDLGVTGSQSSISVCATGKFALTVPTTALHAEDRNSAFLWDLNQQKLVRILRAELPEKDDRLVSGAISPDASFAVIGTATGSILIWSLSGKLE